MTLADFLNNPDAWLGREVVIEDAWLHCKYSLDGWKSLDVFLDAGPMFERQLVVVQSSWVGKWVSDHVPPRPGAPTPYMFPATVRGIVQPRKSGGPPVMAGEYIVLQYEGQLHLGDSIHGNGHR